MAFEIERKFLLSEIPRWLQSCDAAPIEQGYLAVSGKVEIRLRIQDGEHLITVKRGHGEAREEVEVGVDADQFEALWPLSRDQRLAKTRYLVPLDDGLIAEVDVFEGRLQGLIIAEVEFHSEEQSRKFRRPSWFSAFELTGDGRYANQNLARFGLPRNSFSEESSAEKSHPKLGSYRLRRNESPDQGVLRIAHGCVEKALGELHGTQNGDLATAIHSARKEMKKLRAVLRLIREDLGENRFRRENRRYRDIGRLLGPSRDFEVKLETLNALHEHFADEFPSSATLPWRRVLERERDQLFGAGNGEAQRQIMRAQIEVREGRDAIFGLSVDACSWELFEPGLLRSYREGRKAMRKALSAPGSGAVHEWRKRAKDLWYQLRILRNVWPELLEPTADQAHDLSDLLGAHHDLAVLARDLEDRDGIENREAIAAMIERRQSELLDCARDLGRRLYAEKPKAFRRRLRLYWMAWRGG
jgi:CYTH domain-containing protein/CHAD domain-containing protein